MGIGKRFATLICRKAEIDIRKRAGELSQPEIEKVKAIIQNPRQYNIPDWFLNRQKDMRPESRCTSTPISWPPNSERTSRNGRRPDVIADCVITGDSKCADSTPRPMVTETEPSGSAGNDDDERLPSADCITVVTMDDDCDLCIEFGSLHLR